MSKKGFSISMEETLAYPSLAAETRYPVRKVDWNRLKRLLGQVRPEAKMIRIAYSVCFGIAGTAGFSIYPVEGKPSWELFAHIFVSIAALAFAVILLLHDRQDTKSSTGDIKSILKDMQDIEDVFVQEEQAAVSDSERATVIEGALTSSYGLAE